MNNFSLIGTKDLRIFTVEFELPGKSKWSWIKSRRNSAAANRQVDLVLPVWGGFFSVWGREFRNYRNGAAEATCTLLVCKITKVQCVLYVILIQALSNYNTVPGQLIQIVPYSTIWSVDGRRDKHNSWQPSDSQMSLTPIRAMSSTKPPPFQSFVCILLVCTFFTTI